MPDLVSLAGAVMSLSCSSERGSPRARIIAVTVTNNIEESAARSGLIARRRVQSGGKRINLSLEDEFWEAFLEIAASRRISLGDLLVVAVTETPSVNRSSAVRIFVLAHFRRLAAARNGVLG